MRNVLLATVLLVTFVVADDWPQAQVHEVFSPSGDYFVRITPGNSIGDTYGFASAPRGKYATAEFYRRGEDRGYKLVAETTLVNPVAPVQFFVSDRGYLFTLDNWHNVGYGKVAVCYSPDAKLIKAHELTDLFSKKEIEALDHSVSSIWWNKPPSYIRTQDRDVYVGGPVPGNDFVFKFEDCSYQYCRTINGKYTCRTSPPRD